MTPSYLSAIGNVYGLQLISTTASISPIIVNSSNIVSNLNVQYLGGQPAEFYTNASNITQGIIAPSFGGTGLSQFNSGQFLYASTQNQLSQTSNLVYDTTNSNIKINQLNISLPQSNISQAPLIISNSNLVQNLNVQYLGGQISSFYTNANNISSGILSVNYGGTGLSSLSQGFIPFGQGSFPLGYSSNLFWNNSSNYLGIGNSNPQYSVDVVGSVNVTQSLLINGVSVNAGLQVVQKGGTGLSNVSPGYILFGQDSNQLNISSNLTFSSNNQQLKVPNIFISNLSISTSNLITNLNAQYLGGQLGTYYTNANNISTGILAVSYGGTGLTSLQPYQLIFANSSNSYGQTSNVIYDLTNSNLKINQANITLASSNTSQAPLIVSNSNLVSNLNVQYFNSQLASYYTNASNISSGVLNVLFGGTGLFYLSQGFIPFGQGQNHLGSSSNLFWDSTNFRLGIRNSSPQHTIDVVGNITCSSNIYFSNQLISSIGNGTAPFSIASSTLVTNLNVQYLNNQVGSYYTNANNISSGTLAVQYGGTGFNTLSIGQIPFGQGYNSFGSSSNLFWNNTSNFLGIGNSNPQYSIDVIGSVNVTQQLLINGVSVNAGLQVVQKGGTGLSNVLAGYILFGQDSNQLNTSSNLTFNTTNQQLIVSSISISSQLNISFSNLVSNLNAQYLGGQLGNYYTNASNISSGVLAVTFGGTGLSSLQTGFLPFGQGSDLFGSSSNLFWNSTSNFLGIGTSTPSNPLDVVGNIRASFNITANNQLISTVNTGVSPLQISSTTLVSNLNVQRFNNNTWDYYTNATNITSGILNTLYGGTGLSSFQTGLVLYASSSNTLAQTCNFAYNSSNSNIQLSQLNVTLPSSNTTQSPLIVSNSNLVSNLNVQFLNSQPSSFYTNASNISSGILTVSYGGTGITNMSTGFIHFGYNGVLGQSSNLFWNNTSNFLGIGNSNPQYSIDVTGSLNVTQQLLINGVSVNAGLQVVQKGGTGLSNVQPGYILFGQDSNQLNTSSNLIFNNSNQSLLISSISITSNLTISTSNLITNLNAQFLGGQLGSYYTNVTNISAGVLAVSYGGTGLTSLQSNQLVFASSSNSFGQTSNVIYDQVNSNLKINQANITLAASNTTLAPFIVSNSNLVSNLNVQYLNGQLGSYYTNASNINSGILSVTYGGTGLAYFSQGFIPFGQGSSSIGSSSNLFWDSTNFRLGIRNSFPQHAIDVVGSITCSSNLYLSNQFISTVGIGTAPFNIVSTTLVTNLNVQYLGGQSSSYYTNASNINSGMLSTFYGGTGLSSFQSGFVLYASSSNTLAQTCNLVYNSSNSNVQISQLNVTLSSSNTSQAPFIISNSNLVSNLNVQYLNGQLGFYYTNATNINSGILSVAFGGTGITSVSNGFLFVGSNNSFTQSSNLFYNYSSNFLGINTSNPSYPLDINGNTNIKGNLTITGNIIVSGTSSSNTSNVGSSILTVNSGGTGLSSITQGFIPFGQGSNPLGQSSNLFWNYTSNYLGINTSSPSNAIDVIGNVRVSSNIISSNQFVSTLATGTSPFSITSTTLVSNLNVQYFNGQLASYYTNSSNISSGILGVAYGGTGVSNMQNGFIHFGSNGILGQQYNLFWNNTSNYLGIGTSNPSAPLNVVGQGLFTDVVKQKKYFFRLQTYSNSSISNGNNLMAYQYLLEYQNITFSNFSNLSTFTPPVAGLWTFTTSAWLQNGSNNGAFEVYVARNTLTIDNTKSSNITIIACTGAYYNNTTGTSVVPVSGTGTAFLSTTDYVCVCIWNQNSNSYSINNSDNSVAWRCQFQGTLVQPS